MGYIFKIYHSVNKQVRFLVKHKIFMACLLIYPLHNNAQEKNTTIGLVLKNTIPNTIFRTKTPIQITQNNLNVDVEGKHSISFGMVLRKSLTNVWSIESGLYSIKRNQILNFSDKSNNLTENLSFAISSYEIPIQALIYVKINPSLYVDASSGVSINFFPSHVGNSSEKITHLAVKNQWITPSAIVSTGMEYRTKKSGYIYFGGSYHVYFFPSYESQVVYENNGVKQTIPYLLSGNYFSLDIKYFFYEDKKKETPKLYDHEL